jgi:hypothetical protein
MGASTSIAAPEEDVNNLIQMVADEHGLEFSIGLPTAGGQIPQPASAVTNDADTELTRRLAELKAR